MFMNLEGITCFKSVDKNCQVLIEEARPRSETSIKTSFYIFTISDISKIMKQFISLYFIQIKGRLIWYTEIFHHRQAISVTYVINRPSINL